MKLCNKCGETKPLDGFHKNSRKRDGYCTTCKVCACAKSKAWVIENPERHSANCKRYQLENKERCAQKSKDWVSNNLQKSRAIKAAWKTRNPETVRRHARESARRDPVKQAARKKAYLSVNAHVARAYLKRRRVESPLQRVTDAMGNAMRDAIRGRKSGKGWRQIVGYSVIDLRMHLEALFADGMSWDNYGEWHIDHVRPVSSFDFTNEPHVVAKACWALTNLQPLWAMDNMKKGARYDHG